MNFNNCVIFATHPDDEILGCGGTLLKMKSLGCSIHWIILTSIYFEDQHTYVTFNSSGDKIIWEDNIITPPSFSFKKVTKRYKEISEIKKECKFNSTSDLGFPAMCLDQLSLGSIIRFDCKNPLQ